jgi:hypothetical protein
MLLLYIIARVKSSESGIFCEEIAEILSENAAGQGKAPHQRAVAASSQARPKGEKQIGLSPPCDGAGATDPERKPFF